MGIEADLAVTDHVEAQLVECAVPEPPVEPTRIPEPPASSPTERAAESTIAHTGADPPPEVTRG